jgi:hypothetical protein
LQFCVDFEANDGFVGLQVKFLSMKV